MPAPVYSFKFHTGVTDPGAVNTVITVPTGFVYVVRYVTMYQTAASGCNCRLWLAAPLIILLHFEPSTAQQWRDFDCRLVLAAGDQLQVRPAVNGAHVSISGYKLTV